MSKIEITAILETKKNAIKKYQLVGNKLKFDNILPKGMKFPFYYGFIPETLAGDGDALDIIVLSNKILPTKKPTIFKVIGMFKMIDTGDEDNKIIAVTTDNKVYKNITDVNQKTLEKIEQFFASYKPKRTKTKGFIGIIGAQKHIKMAKNAYKR